MPRSKAPPVYIPEVLPEAIYSGVGFYREERPTHALYPRWRCEDLENGQLLGWVVRSHDEVEVFPVAFQHASPIICVRGLEAAARVIRPVPVKIS